MALAAPPPGALIRSARSDSQVAEIRSFCLGHLMQITAAGHVVGVGVDG